MTIQNKNKLLAACFILALFICYYLAFSETFSVKREYDNLKDQQLIAKNLPAQLISLKQKNKKYDSLLAAYQISETSWQNNLLYRIDRYAKLNELKILKIEEPHTFTSNGLKVSSYAIALSGDFDNLLGLLYELEQQANFGQLANVHFIKEIDYRTKATHLEMRFLVQVIN
ncbi:hypothetical protein DSM03_11615 [Leeuwenhoekiella aestuarii]|uniref:hypothetical protein n=1 Tax=Leeuwenhoekiella aestuarii TaxID=2249426 RepID=UPI000FFF0B21|nr:hypothetical protein [Leeuwenhoekiella aestuarii]RXG11484.1 hypothetical protein DSM03_11615 [Leeuwenhoekiella aestuarii]